jgi:2-methylcitrate dehydratase
MIQVVSQQQLREFSAEVAARLPDLARRTEPDAVVLRIADTVACAVGTETLSDAGEGSESTVARVRRLSGTSHQGSVTIWATGKRTGLDDAAFRNAVCARFLDYNDTYIGRAIIHPSDMIAALVALAEARGVSWSRLIEAIGVAYEVLCRLADAADLRSHGFDASTLTPLGTAAGAAWLLQLDPERTARALRIAALDAGMLRAVRQGRLLDWKAMASGHGAVKGLLAGRMAEAGCIPPDRVFEGPEGFFARISGPLEISGDDALLPRTLLKKYPAQIFIQGLLELALQLRPKLTNVATIDTITIRTFGQAVDMVGGHGKDTATLNRETADHSAAFAVAAVLLGGRLGHGDYDALLNNPGVLTLMRKIHVEKDAAADVKYPQSFPARIHVNLSDGREFEAAHEHPARMDIASFRNKLDQLWPADRPRAWPWELQGIAPPLPG